MSHLVIMAAGTGGHIFPGLAVAREMQTRGWTVSWLGTSHGMENKLVPPTGILLDTIGFSGVRGKGLLHTATGGIPTRRHVSRTPSSPATRCAPRSKRCPIRHCAVPAGVARCGCWSSVAASVRRC
jgi:hypothetical protein